ncbi:O-antigen ligase family protein [Niveibacterium sp. SC-1]|uniref:O-antigen ligase family protein n=1 Tax=Niveibacterium sp. SC-1 TaxID=3135646 RepID=UPI00311E9B1C
MAWLNISAGGVQQTTAIDGLSISLGAPIRMWQRSEIWNTRELMFNASLSDRSTRSQTPVQALPMLLSAALLVVWPMPGTIAARYIIAVLLLASVLAARPNYSVVSRLTRNRAAFLPWLLLSLWIVVQIIFLAWDPRTSWHESAQWWRSSLFFLTGMLAATIPLSGKGRDRWLSVLLSSGFVYLLGYFLLKPWHAPDKTLDILFMLSGVFGSRDLASHVGCYLVAILIGVSLSRLAGRTLLAYLNDKVVIALLTVAIAATVLTLTRNALIVLLVLCGLGSIAYGRLRVQGRPAHWIGILLLCATVLGAALATSLLTDKRWAHFGESVSAGWQTERYTGWLERHSVGLPKLSDGSEADESAYLRTAWAKEMVRELALHPLGVGYNRNAFRTALRARFGNRTEVAHGHAGFLDFGIGTGLPGLALIIAFFVGLQATGLRQWRTQRDAVSLILFLMVTGFVVRSVVDSVLRDHMLEEFMFIVGLLLGLQRNDNDDPAVDQAKA